MARMNPDGEFSGQTVVVTGASRGIGFAVARLFGQRGATLLLVSRNREALQDAALRLGSESRRAVESVAGDVADPDTASRVRELAHERFGGVDILANIAGVFPTARLEDISDAQFNQTLDVNLRGTFNLCRALVPLLRERQGSAIVNMSSTAARFPTPGLSVYSACKAGIEAFTRSIAAELAPRVRVNAVSAGPTLTETVEALVAVDTTGAVAAVTQALPLQRLAQPEEIAEAVAYLASSRARFVTGQVLHVNGGGVMA